MSEYTRYEIKGKGFRYRKNGKLITKDDVPVEEIKRLEDEEFPAEPVQVTDKSCLFCGAYSNWQRLVNGQSVYVCEEHYYNETIGKVAQKLREREHARV